MSLGRIAFFLIPFSIAVVLFQNFKSAQPNYQERVLIPSASNVVPESTKVASPCGEGEDPVVLIRLLGLQSGERVSIKWQDTENGQVKLQNVRLPLSLGDCPAPQGANEFLVCPAGKIGYFDVKIISESGETGYLSGPVSRGCEREPLVVEAAMQSERR